MLENLAATDAQTLKNIALGLSGGSILLAVILLKVVSSLIGKVISTVLLVAIALAGYSQREEITSCVKDVTNQSGMTLPTEISCTFFGQDISVKVPLTSQ